MRIKFQAESLSFCATGQVFVQSTLIVQSPSGESIANLKESVSFIPAGGPSDQRFSFQWRSSSVNGAPVFDLDHVTGGRIGWNVVTGYLNSAAKGIGLARQPEHDTRYEIAEEYMQILRAFPRSGCRSPSDGSGRGRRNPCRGGRGWRRSRQRSPCGKARRHSGRGACVRIPWW